MLMYNVCGAAHLSQQTKKSQRSQVVSSWLNVAMVQWDVNGTEKES